MLKNVLLIVILTAGLLAWGTPRVQPKPSDIWSALYERGSSDGLSQLLASTEKKTGISADLLRAIIFTESGFNPHATSRSGARGLMQVLPSTAMSQGFSPSYEMQQNIGAGASYLQSMLQRYDGDLTLALAAYNAGPKSVEKYGGIPPYRETQRYVAKVMALYNFFKKGSE